jgi:hypothetical protein
VTGIGYLDALHSRKPQRKLPCKALATLEVKLAVDHQYRPIERFPPRSGLGVLKRVGEVLARIAGDHARQQRMRLRVRGSQPS